MWFKEVHSGLPGTKKILSHDVVDVYPVSTAHVSTPWVMELASALLWKVSMKSHVLEVDLMFRFL